jgi:hypothetical protein
LNLLPPFLSSCVLVAFMLTHILHIYRRWPKDHRFEFLLNSNHQRGSRASWNSLLASHQSQHRPMRWCQRWCHTQNWNSAYLEFIIHSESLDDRSMIEVGFFFSHFHMCRDAPAWPCWIWVASNTWLISAVSNKDVIICESFVCHNASRWPQAAWTISQGLVSISKNLMSLNVWMSDLIQWVLILFFSLFTLALPSTQKNKSKKKPQN